MYNRYISCQNECSFQCCENSCREKADASALFGLCKSDLLIAAILALLLLADSDTDNTTVFIALALYVVMCGK